MYVIKILALTLGFTSALLCVLFAAISIGFGKWNVRKVRAYLDTFAHKRDVTIGRPAVRYPHYTTATYTYRVDNRQYHISYSFAGTPQNAPKTLFVYYQIPCPGLARIENAPILQPIAAVLLGILAVIFLILGFLI